MAIVTEMEQLAKGAREAAKGLARVSTDQKDRALRQIAGDLRKRQDKLLEANHVDVRAAQQSRLPQAFVDRLTLNEQRIDEMCQSLEAVATLPDPVGEVMKMWTRPNGLRIGKMRIPIGVICVIYESRPNVTCDCAALGIKSGNAMILKGGKEALHSNRAIVKILTAGLQANHLPLTSIQLVETVDRRAVEALLQLDHWIDLVIPRGSEEMIREITNKSHIPVLKHAKGLCHVYVDEGANLDQAIQIAYNAKCQRPGVCNAMETLLVHRGIAKAFLPKIAKRYREAGVELRGDPGTRQILQGIKPARPEDWDTEYLDLILSIRVVDSFEEALDHIERHSSGLSEAIVTEDYAQAMRFLREVDSACVYVNASTRFTDGHQFGLGAEIGISTDRLHARGPMALEELTTYKYIIFGSGQVRES